LSCFIPFNIVNNPAFRRVIHQLRHDTKIPYPKKLTSILHHEYKLVLNTIRGRLPVVSKISLALDSWTSPNRYGIISVLAYWMSNAFELESCQLSFEECRGSHNGEALAAHVLEILKRFRLDTGRLMAITTDGAGNNGTMSKNLSVVLKEQRGIEWNSETGLVHCMAHVIQLALKAFFDSLGVKQREKYYGDVETSKTMAGGVKQYKKIKTAVRLAKFQELPAGIGKTIEKQRRLAVVVNSSSQRIESYLNPQDGNEKYAVTLILDVRTRWNSMQLMLSRALRLRAYSVQWLADRPEYAMLRTSKCEWRVIEYIIHVTQPFHYWTLWMSMRHNVTIHRVIRIYNQLFDHLDGCVQKLTNKRSEWKKDVKSGLIYILAHCLDPTQKFKVFKIWDMDENYATHYEQDYKKAVLDYFKKNYAPSPSPSPATPENTTIQPTQRHRKERRAAFDSDESSDEDKLSEFDRKPGQTYTLSPYQQAIIYAERYINDGPIKRSSLHEPCDYIGENELKAGYTNKVNFFSFWRTEMNAQRPGSAPFLRMVRDVYSVIPHGVGVEGSFSLGRQALSWRQHRMKASTLSKFIVVRQWQEKEVREHHKKCERDAHLAKIDYELELLDLTHHKVAMDNLHLERRRAYELGLAPGCNEETLSRGYISDVDETAPDVELVELSETDSPNAAEAALSVPRIEKHPNVSCPRIVQLTRSEFGSSRLRLQREVLGTEEDESEPGEDEWISEQSEGSDTDVEAKIDGDDSDAQADDESENDAEVDTLTGYNCQNGQRKLGFPAIPTSTTTSRLNQGLSVISSAPTTSSLSSSHQFVSLPLRTVKSKRLRESLGTAGGIAKRNANGSGSNKGRRGGKKL
jgi:hypothetical protein